MGNIVFFERPRSRSNKSFVEAVLRRAHLLSLASSSVAPTQVWIDEAVVVDFPRAVAAAPSLTGSTTTTQSSDGGHDGK